MSSLSPDASEITALASETHLNEIQFAEPPSRDALETLEIVVGFIAGQVWRVGGVQTESLTLLGARCVRRDIVARPGWGHAMAASNESGLTVSSAWSRRRS